MSFEESYGPAEEDFHVDKMRYNLLHTPYHRYKEPIPSDHLTDIWNFPKDYKTKDKNIWAQKLSDLVKSYNLYVDAVHTRRKNKENSYFIPNEG